MRFGLGLLSLVSGLNIAAYAQPALTPGNIQLIMQGTLELPAGDLYAEEKRLNIIAGSATYEDGSVLDATMHQEGWQYGFYGEYTLTDQFGVQLGVDFRGITQKVSAGGGSYEEQIWAEATLLSFTHPFLGFSYYLLNEDEINIALSARLGSVVNGSIYPLATDFTYLGLTPQRYALTGYTAGAGLSLGIISGLWVLGGAFFATDNLLRTPEKIYPNLGQTFSAWSYDLSLYLGLRF